MVAAEFWEQGDLERNVLDQQPIVRVFCTTYFLHCDKTFYSHYIHRKNLLWLFVAYDGQKLCGTATQDAVRFHRLCLLICIQGNDNCF